MILISRGTEPQDLTTIRTKELAKLRALGRPPTSEDINGYKIVAEQLWRAQHRKCCYCEQKLPKSYNDVEHYRPKARADRKPGCLETHGYWWLAFTWSNLLFACPSCNRSAKNDRFPLAHGSVALQSEATEPGTEYPLLLNPGSTMNPVEHIMYYFESRFNDWWAKPRNASLYGLMTIDVCDLNRGELRELRTDYVERVVIPQVKALEAALSKNQTQGIQHEFDRAIGLLGPENPYVTLSYDVLCKFISRNSLQTAIQTSWPAPHQVGCIN